jgi:hypothetical protein
MTGGNSSSRNVSPKLSRNAKRRQSAPQKTQIPVASPTAGSQLRHVSTIAPASILAAKSPVPSQPKKQPLSPASSSKKAKRHLHASIPKEAHLSDDVHLPTFTHEIPIEHASVPILPQTQRAAPRIEIETPEIDHPIITAAGAHTHPAPPGSSSGGSREHLQSDSSKPRTQASTEKQDGRFEGDRSRYADSGAVEATYHFEPEMGDIPAADRNFLWGVVGAATLWGMFGPGKKKK